MESRRPTPGLSVSVSDSPGFRRLASGDGKEEVLFARLETLNDCTEDFLLDVDHLELTPLAPSRETRIALLRYSASSFCLVVSSRLCSLLACLRRPHAGACCFPHSARRVHDGSMLMSPHTSLRRLAGDDCLLRLHALWSREMSTRGVYHGRRVASRNNLMAAFAVFRSLA